MIRILESSPSRGLELHIWMIIQGLFLERNRMKSSSMWELITYATKARVEWMRALSTWVTQIQHVSPTTHLAISPLLPRSDNLDFNDKIKEANKVLKSFCSSRGLTLLGINNIDLTCLNRRGAHLNRKGSSLLLNCYVDYLNSNWLFGNEPAIPTTSRSNENSNRECISESDLTFSLPKLKGFKIAFLNIISLPKYLDELRLRMQSQTLDLLALCETRLDNTFTDSAVSIDGYTLIRRDQCRGGGGVAI